MMAPTSPRYDDSEGSRGFTRIGVAAIAAVLTGLALWSTLVPIDELVVAPGHVASATERTAVRHPTGGLISEVLVGEADEVEAGALLARLDASTTPVSEVDLADQVTALAARRVRLLVERDGLSAEQLEEAFAAFLADSPNPNAAQFVEAERALFTTRRESQETQSSLRSDRIARERQRAAGLNSQRQALSAQMDIVFQELLSAQEQNARGIAPATRVSQLELETEALRTRDGELMARINEAEAAVAAVQLEEETARQALNNALVGELAELERDLSAVQSQRSAAAEQLQQLEIRAPRAGRVTGLGGLAAGDVVGPGDALFHVVPSDDAFSVRAQLRPQDAAQVQAGAPTRVRIMPIGGGRVVETMGAVRTVAREPSADPATGRAYYPALIELPPEYAQIGVGSAQSLTPGMPAEVTVMVGRGRAYQLLLRPLAGAGSPNERAHAQRNPQ